MRFWQIHLVVVTVTCIEIGETKRKNPLPYYARQIQEDTDDSNKLEDPRTDVSKNNLVSLLVNNVKEIFSNNEDSEMCISPTKTRTTKTTVFLPENLTQTTETVDTDDAKVVNEVFGCTKMSQTSLIDSNLNESIPLVSNLKMDKEHNMIRFRKEISMQKSQQKLIDKVTIDLSSSNSNKTRRSCIFCDNVRFEDCSEPKKKLIPSVVCKNESDLCYSQHTPFGIVDRGCFNPENSLTTFVCSCNLCNFIPISEMPYVFKNQREWVQNVVELSRTRNLIKSVFKNMACLRCEVNATNMKENADDVANCLAGNIGSVPTQICEENEVCAVKVIKGKGYIWRGCVGTPLYNYWWALCDSDLCNYDSLISVFEYL